MEISEKCKILTSEQTNYKDFYAIQLSDKLEVCASSVKKILHRDVFYNILLNTFFPNVDAQRIFLSLPISVASAEQSFSKLKLIKNYFRSIMLDTRLVDLAITSIAHR